MNLLRVIEIINEEVQNWFDDEPSIADRIYQRRGIATTPKQPLRNNGTNGELIGYITKTWGGNPLKTPVAVYENPKNLSGFEGLVRGILTSNGNAYIAQNGDGLHADILQLLLKEGIIPSNTFKINYTQEMPEEFISVLRNGSNKFTQSDDYDDFPFYYEDMFELANEKHSYKFIPTPIDN